ncbi:DAK2 domain-containing protein [Sinobaca sp. H24]|uniref:DAK2 domain-containing protein n=1 Tax=Sinobaca sp. H24 TaxID=2923376 RepID=UPI0035B379D6
MLENELKASKLADMLGEGAAMLHKHAQEVDALNVFPVPDGDTGKNMNLTISSGIKEVLAADNSESAGKTAKAFSKGLLMGARGNSGVILSQLFRGFSQVLDKETSVTASQLAAAFNEGVHTAYKAVMKPVEGTILTVAREGAAYAESRLESSTTPVEYFRYLVEGSEQSLAGTPELLPILKEVGVVDSGGQGLVYIYTGMYNVLAGLASADSREEVPSLDDLVKLEHHQQAQTQLSTEDMEYGYCTEVMIRFEEDKLKKTPYDETAFREELSEWGDSLLVVHDEELLKIHIHAEYPGEVINKAQRYGSLRHIKAEDMREQHQAIVEKEAGQKARPVKPKSRYGVVVVSAGPGMDELFQGMGAHEIISGGQTMNPSTEDFLQAIERVNAEHIFLLPNNGNIIMAAGQAAEVAEKQATVIETKTIPEGLSALLALDESKDVSVNKRAMTEAKSHVKSGEVTFSVRDTVINGRTIAKNDYMGICGKEIISAGPDIQTVANELLGSMIDEDTEIVTIIEGEDSDEATSDALQAFIESHYEDAEVERHQGGQPLYPYIISIE